MTVTAMCVPEITSGPNLQRHRVYILFLLQCYIDINRKLMSCLSPVCSPACPSHPPKTMIASLLEDIIVYNKNVLYLIHLLGIPHLRLVVGQ